MKINELINIMTKYGEAWESQDPDKITELFTTDGTYQDIPFNTPMEGLNEIRDYWIKYPVKDQKNIKFQLGKCSVYEGRGYAEWISNFDQVESGKHVEVRGIILITMRDGKIKDLWEYWHSDKS